MFSGIESVKSFVVISQEFEIVVAIERLKSQKS